MNITTVLKDRDLPDKGWTYSDFEKADRVCGNVNCRLGITGKKSSHDS